MAMHLNQGAGTVHDIKPELERKVLQYSNNPNLSVAAILSTITHNVGHEDYLGRSLSPRLAQIRRLQAG